MFVKWLKSLGSAGKIKELQEDIDYYQIRINVLEQQLSERNQTYRTKVGEKEELREKCNLLDNALTKANKVLDEILEVAESNDYNRPSMKVKKIIELAKTRNTTSPIK